VRALYVTAVLVALVGAGGLSAWLQHHRSRGAQVETPAVAPAQPAAPVGTAPTRLREYWLRMEFALYCARERDVPTRAALQAALRRVPRFHLVDKLEGETAMISSPELTIDKLPAPAREILPFASAGLSDADQAKLAAARGVRALAILAPTDAWAETLADTNAVVAALADKSGCFVWDQGAKLAFTPRGFREQRVAKFDPKKPRLAPQVNAHAYRDGELLRIVTLGMEKAGLPDVSVDQFPSAVGEQMQALVFLVCEAMSATKGPTATVRVDGPDGRHVDVALASVTPAEGDEDNRQVTIVFPGPASESLQQRQHRLLDAVFGAIPPKASSVKPGDPELNAARQRARAQLPRVKAAFKKGLAADDRLSVKVPFHVEDNVEWMWIEVTAWTGATVRGVLHDDSVYASGPRAGAHVSAAEADIFDYYLEYGDGREEGNETSRILQRRQ
jgi:uncharacterized protein YegJ (DUF2314 family)